MAYDEHLAVRVREQLAPEPGLTEKATFGDAPDGEQALAGWVSEGVTFARSLPPKG